MAAFLIQLLAPRALAALGVASLAILAIPQQGTAQGADARSTAVGEAGSGSQALATPRPLGTPQAASPPRDPGPVGVEVEASGVLGFRPGRFLERQLQNPRVQGAFERKAERVDAVLEASGVADMGEVFFRVFKREQELEVWARAAGAEAFVLVNTYPVCEVSGELGPKRRQGDLQIPEGFYTIDVFNPASRFHLSMRVDYPNAVDRVRSPGQALGGDIYIHGGCATIGCVPVTDEYIEELYLVAAAARDAGQRRIPVHIFPTRLADEGLDWLTATYGPDHVDHPFWRNLQEGYEAFETTRVVPRVGYDGGQYTFSRPRARTPLGTPLHAPLRPGLDPTAPTGLGAPVAPIAAGPVTPLLGQPSRWLAPEPVRPNR